MSRDFPVSRLGKKDRGCQCDRDKLNILQYRADFQRALGCDRISAGWIGIGDFGGNFGNWWRLGIGTIDLAGLVAGLVGVGGGAIMVPLQMLLLGETIKVAIQTSLSVVVLTAISATIGHSINSHVAIHFQLFTPRQHA